LRLTIIHGTDAAYIVNELRKFDVPVIIGPVLCDRSKPELARHNISTAARLAEKGVRFAIATDHPVVPVQYLLLSAGIAIRGGLSADKALRTITSWDGDPLREIESTVAYTIIDGNIVYRDSQ
jgi:imidazolonepropionase-like amidohydrolase